MRSRYFLIFFLCFLFLSMISCKKQNNEQKYDIILVIGQSNTCYGIGYDKHLDKENRKIKQLGRFNDNNLQIISAKEPLDNFDKYENKIGFALTFAKKYLAIYLQSNREILIIPGGKGSTGFLLGDWNPGDSLYEDAVMRTNYVLHTYPNSRVVAILWQQGEADVYNDNFQQNLDSMIVSLRRDIMSDEENIPFILGGMVPYWVNRDTLRQKTNNIIAETPSRIINTAYADPTLPFIISKSDNSFEDMHYDAAGLRELGCRYFNEYNILFKIE